MKTRKKSEASGVAFAASSVQSTSLESQLQAFVRFQQRAKLCSWRPHKKPSNAVNLSFVRNESFWVPCSRETQGKVIWSHRQVNFDRVLRDAKSHSVAHCWAQQNCGCWTTLFRYWVFMSPLLQSPCFLANSTVALLEVSSCLSCLSSHIWQES